MYNRYVGNTGRFIRVDDEPIIAPRAEIIDRPNNREREHVTEREHVREHESSHEVKHAPEHKDAYEHPARHRTEQRPSAPRGGGGLLSSLLGGGGILGGKGLFGGKSLGFLDNILPFGMDTGDLALIVLFFFLYLESGDDEFLIIMAFLAYSIFKERPR